MKAFIFFLTLVCGASTAHAERVRFFDLEGFGTWLDGNPESTEITEEGRIELPTTTRERFSDPGIAFSAATAWGEDIACARVDDAGIMLIDRAGKSHEFFQAKETMVSSLLATGGYLYVAAGPPARLLRINAKGQAETIYEPDAEYIWDMVAGPSGNIYIATGEPGRVIEVSPKGHGRELFAPDQTHLRRIAYDLELGLFVGGGERGIVYRTPSTKKLQWHALFDSGHPEITGLVLRNAHAYITAVTGAAALAHFDQWGKAKAPEVRSQLIEVGMDGTSEVLAGSSDEAIFDAAIDDRGRVIVATGGTGRSDPRGRIYAVIPRGAHNQKHEIAMTYQSPSRRITHLVALPRGAMAAIASDGGRIVHMAGGIAKKGDFITEPFDATIHARYGTLEIFSDTPKGTHVSARVRSGQTAKPDNTWSPWSKPMTIPWRTSPHVPSARFSQIKLTLMGNGVATPSVTRVRMAYLRQNLRPFIREVVALRKGLALLPLPREASKSKNINLAEKPGRSERRASNLDKPKARAKQIQRPGALTVRWVAEDPNGDTLRYDLMVRGITESSWRTVEEKMDRPFYTLESEQLPDGHYTFKVRATDAPSNPSGSQRSDSRQSRTVLVDNTPPRIDPLQITTRAHRVTVRTVVSDAVGPLVNAQYSVDGEPFVIANPDDGVLDGPGESFNIHLGVLNKGSHSITLRVMDEGENTGRAESIFTVH